MEETLESVKETAENLIDGDDDDEESDQDES